MASQDNMPPFITPGRVYNVRFGKSLVDKPRRKHDHSYQSISFDFKPISLSDTKAAKLSVNHEENSLAITVPRDSASGKHEAPAETESTLFRGPKRPCQKDFVLIWNHHSGEVTLERLECTPTLKQKRTGNWPPPSTYAATTESTPEPPKPKGKVKAKKSPSSSKSGAPSLPSNSDPLSSVPAATSSFKRPLSGFVAGPNLESVPNSAEPGAGADREKGEASDSDSGSSSSSDYTSSTDGSDSSEDTAAPKTDLPPLHDPLQLQLKNNVDLSEGSSDSN